MSISSGIRKTLHSYGIHSATIQPEFVRIGDDNKIDYIAANPCDLNTIDKKFLYENDIIVSSSKKKILFIYFSKIFLYIILIYIYTTGRSRVYMPFTLY